MSFDFTSICKCGTQFQFQGTIPLPNDISLQNFANNLYIIICYSCTTCGNNEYVWDNPNNGIQKLIFVNNLKIKHASQSSIPPNSFKINGCILKYKMKSSVVDQLKITINTENVDSEKYYIKSIQDQDYSYVKNEEENTTNIKKSMQLLVMFQNPHQCRICNV
jgi:hypothetical protein